MQEAKVNSLEVEWEALEAHDREFGITDPTDEAIERTLTARAYRSLPDRWQAVLWYTEVEGMDPHEVAPLLGLTANGVAALAYRARDGLRTAWLQAHVTSDGLSGECRWAAERTARGARGGLRETEARRLRDHRSTCARCAIVAEEVDDLGARLALTLEIEGAGEGVEDPVDLVVVELPAVPLGLDDPDGVVPAPARAGPGANARSPGPKASGRSSPSVTGPRAVWTTRPGPPCSDRSCRHRPHGARGSPVWETTTTSSSRPPPVRWRSETSEA